MGILRRAKLRDKELPIQLETALKIQAEEVDCEIVEQDELRSYHINQRHETIDLDGISGALMTNQSLQMQTFVKEPTFPVLMDQGGQRMDVEDNMVGTLRASMGGNQPIVLGSTKPNAEIAIGLSPTVTASAGGGGGNTPILFDNHPKDCRYNGPLEVAPTIAATYGTGGNNVPLVKQESYCIAANTINRDAKNGGNGLGCQTDIAYTLTTNDIHSVYKPEHYQNVVGTLMHRDHKGVNSCYVAQDKCIIDDNTVFGQSSYGGYGNEVSTLTASGGYLGGGSENLAVKRNLVRRLTPLECERLQGFPDDWTKLEKAADSPRYKALGNSVAIPCVDFVMRGIAFCLNKQKKGEEQCNTFTQNT